MRDQEVLMKNYPTTPDTLWEAVKQALTTADGVTLKQADDAEKTASFETGVTWTSWGQNMRAKIEPLDSGKARLRIVGQIRNTFLSSNWGEELHEKGLIQNLTKAIDQAL